MAREINRLNVQKVKGLKEPGRHADGNGLYLNIKNTGAKSWVFVTRRGGKRIERGLGSVSKVTLAAAREKTRILREEREVEGSERPTEQFRTVATELIESLKPGWSNAKHAQQWTNTLTTHAAAIWDKPVDEIATEDVLSLLQPIWQTVPETASRVRGRIERVMDAAKVRGLRTGENPARWKGHLEVLLPKRKILARGHHRAMPFKQLPAFIQELGTRSALSASALEFLILTTARTSEVIEAEWDEFDLPGKLWVVPAHRMKARAEHRVPLTARAIEILEHVKSDGEAKPFALSNMSMKQLLKRMDLGHFTVHGFRSSFRDWVGEETDFPREIAEAALAHQVGNAVERAYRRGDALEKRRKLMEDWEAYLCGEASG